MKNTALITGASKGIGLELAEVMASKGISLVLVARSGEILDKIKTALKEKYHVSVHIIVKDLSISRSAKEVYDEIKALRIEINYLINNAGFGDYGLFSDNAWERYHKMIYLNVTTLTEFCHLYLSDWKQRGSGKILNVASTAAFQPGPKMAVYFATKAYVLNFSESIGYEVRNEGITVTALCPGPTETHFVDESHMRASDLIGNVNIASAKEVARVGYEAMIKGEPVIIHGFMNRMVTFFERFLPRKIVTMLSGRIMK